MSSVCLMFLIYAIPAVITATTAPVRPFIYPWNTSPFKSSEITVIPENSTEIFPEGVHIEIDVSSSDVVKVSTNQGMVAGVRDHWFSDKVLRRVEKTVYIFHNIPYAVPPIGKRRFKEPERMGKWPGTWDATRERGELVECVQFKHTWGERSTVVGDEDCLYLSVYTPKLPKQDPKIQSTELYSVIVFIHGGSFMYGSQNHFNPKELVRDHAVVFVKFNYRLGPLGFLSTEDKEAPGNMGLRDQIMALEWVRDNIAAFGGNPNSVTLVGSYAGGASVHFHMLSKKSRGLFHRAISISGTMLSPWALAENLLGKTRLLAQQVGCPETDSKVMVECLRKRPASFLADAARVTLPILYNPFSPWAPTVDSFANEPLIPMYPGVYMSHRNGTDIPWLVGISNAEGAYIGAELLRNSFLVHAVSEHWRGLSSFILDYEDTVEHFSKEHVADDIRKEYMSIDNSTVTKGKKKGKDVCEDEFSCKGFLEMIGDRMFVVDAERSARWMSKSTTAPVYFFIFNSDKHNISTKNTDRHEFLSGAEHLNDYYNSVQFNNRLTHPTLEETKAIEFMNNLWSDFAQFGKVVITDWPVVKPDKFSYMEINSGINHRPVVNVTELGRRSFWEQIAFIEHNRMPPGEAIFTLVMLRHGESEWTKANLFCGWYDAKLSANGVKEAHNAGQVLRDAGFAFDRIFTSQLARAQDTVRIIREELGQSPEVTKSWRLNERHYGALTGYNKVEMAEKYGMEQVEVWRRSYNEPPPPMTEDHKYYHDIVDNPSFKIDGPSKDEFPDTESLYTTLHRVLPFWKKQIVPEIKRGKRILVVTHGTVLRGLVQHIERLTSAEIKKVNIPTAIPVVYHFDANLQPTQPRQFLMDEEALAKAMKKVSSITGYEGSQTKQYPDPEAFDLAFQSGGKLSTTPLEDGEVLIRITNL